MDVNVATKRVPKPLIIGFVKYTVTAFKFRPLFTSYVHVPNSCTNWVTLQRVAS